MGISEATFYNRKKKFDDMGVAELRQLEEENYRLKRLVADLSLDKEILQDVIRKSSEAGAETRGGRMPAGGAPHRGSQRIRESAETRIR
jgi:putative transposase